MGRVRTGKTVQKWMGERSKVLKSDNVLKEQIQKLGGSAEDFDLVKNVGNGKPLKEDPALTSEIYSFLDSLKLGKTPSHNTKKSDTPAKDNVLQKSHKSDKKRTSKVDNTSSTRERSKPQKNKEEANTSRGSNKPSKDTSKHPETKTVEPGEKPTSVLPDKVTVSSKKGFKFPPTSQWFSTLPVLNASESNQTHSAAEVQALLLKAADLHAAEIETFKVSSDSETSFFSKIIQSGTLSDRLSALTLLVQSSPVHNLRALDNLKNMAERGKGSGGREESLKALRCIADWWIGGGAPDRKLRYFRDQPIFHPSASDAHLIVWYFEDWLKKYFFSILQTLETLSLDSLPYVRTQAMRLIFILLRDKPEQEQNLLRLLVNKLGDTDKPLCSRASHHLLDLLQPHPSLKTFIIRESIALVLRPPASSAATASLPAEVSKRRIKFADDEKPPKPKISAKHATNIHARYFATITFNQIVLRPGDQEVSLKLIDFYFEIFKELLGERSSSEKKENDEDGTEVVGTDKKGRVMVKKSKGKRKVDEIKGAAGFTEVEDADSKLISAILTGINRALPFAHLSADSAGLMNHIDTLFLITHTSTFNISLQALVLIQQISASLSMSGAASSSSSAGSISDRYYRTLYGSLLDLRLAASSKQAMYLNLLFKSIKADAGNENNERVKAFIRRFVQLLVSGGSGATEFVAGGLYLLGELFSTIPGLRAMLNKPVKDPAELYDPRKRDPQYAHASSSPLWELTPLMSHYHPAISLHARQILSSQPLTATADLSLNTLSHFLDRFVYKNPKKKVNETKGGSAMQPDASAFDGISVKLIKGENLSKSGPVNEQAFLRKRAQDVPVDEIFFHKFFTQKQERERVAKLPNEQEDDEEDNEDANEDEDIVPDEDGPLVDEMDLTGDETEQHINDFSSIDEDSDLNEDEIWEAMKGSMPQAEGDSDLENDDSDDDIDLNDLDNDDDEDDDLSLAEDSDNEDLISLGDMPDGLIEFDGDDDAGESEAEGEWGGISNKKRKNEEGKGGGKRKKRRLPTFASYEDYAKMIDDAPEDDI